MILSLKSFGRERDVRHFFCSVDDLEPGFEVLSLLVSQREIVLEAYITDENTRVDLPVEAFDGQPFREPIRNLERQWNEILAESTPEESTDYTELDACSCRLVAVNQEVRIGYINSCIAGLLVLRQRAQETLSDVHLPGGMVQHYQRVTGGHRGNRARIKACQHLNFHTVKRPKK
ncbi:MAG: hypothetical protein H7Z72_06685 [Bacteroidetes bacterium]|nr:hypothetical protein [Fibrella sp.]